MAQHGGRQHPPAGLRGRRGRPLHLPRGDPDRSPEWPTIRPHRLAVGLYNVKEGRLVRDGRLELDVDGERTEIAELAGEKKPDLLLLNDDDLAYAKIRLDDASLLVAIDFLSAIESPLARSLVWGSAWDSTRDAETAARDYVQLVLRNIGAETESTTLRTVLAQVQTTATMYVAPERRESTLEEVGDAFWTLANEAAPGSDAQFQFLKAFAAVAHTPTQLDNVQAVLDEKVALDGLDIDTDLGWELLIALAAGGRAGREQIEATLASDNTATGRQSAAHAFAALPTASDKEAAWKSIVEETNASNLIVRSTGLGFLRASDPSLLEPFVARYFGSLTTIWENRSYAIASGIITGFYPASLANQALVDATRAWLEAHPETPALRRLIIENLAGVERALRVQARDAA
ncbi:hypothetical protein GCM10025866_24010 [Naasia aerilata]|uniref:ERAP1-like C-terminal domain-containing protein n=1 Tax=Naasia aerilata TaxID=1162966 RepID=A0ABN6XND4_9MICO|nr:hypothetical protein GCM10025866_24010 [Naasia aerilata]